MLYLLPDELLVAIVEYCDQKTRKNLSLVSRRLRNPSQHTVFKTVYIPGHIFDTISTLAIVGGELLPAILQNDRLLSYIQTIVIAQGMIFQHLGVNNMELLFTALHQMQQLRDIKLDEIPFTTTMLDRLREVLSTRLYNVELWSCTYPADYTVQQAVLEIHRFRLVLGGHEWINGPPPTTKVAIGIIQRSLSSIAILTLSHALGVLAYLGTMPRLISLNIILKSDSNHEGLSSFLVANPQLVEFTLEGSFYDLSLLPPSALPNLTTILVDNAEMIRHLVPGRPVAKVEIFGYSKYEIMMDGLHALSRSAAPIVELTLPFHHYFTHLYDVLGAVVKVVPRLERMSLSFRAEVRRIPILSCTF